MQPGKPPKDLSVDSLAANRGVFAKCTVGNLSLKLPYVENANVVLIDPLTNSLSQGL